MLRLKTYLNFGWRFTEDYSPNKSKNENFDFTLRPVDIPHNVTSGKFNYFDGTGDKGKLVQYSKLFVLPAEMEGKRIILHFDGVTTCAAVFINDKAAFAHKGGFTGFSQDITDFLNDSENKITVIVDSLERSDTPPYGAPIDFISYGGIYRDVWIEALPEMYIKDTFIRTVMTDKGWKLDITGAIGGDSDKEKRKLTFSLYDGPNRLGTCQYRAEHPEYHVSWNVSAAVTPWTPENPKLYVFKVALSGGDEMEYTIGFRQIKIESDGLYLNERKTMLVGINRMQNYPYTGFAMPASAQRGDADLIKSMGFNAVRTARYPQSGHFLDRCDEIGLMVIADVPGYKHAEGGEWLDTLVQNAQEMVISDRNHPSVIMWGTRADDTQDNPAVNRKICNAVRGLDASRPMYGVRCFKESDVLEEVYGYNDYEKRNLNEPFSYDSENIALGKTPVIITEHTGHLYPARICDNEKTLLDQALSHARILDAALASHSVIGVFGWCLHDYNAHPSFGGNDGVCSYGICDLRRIPKLAAAVYYSNFTYNPYLELSSAMMPGEHRGGVIGKVYAFTNCDSVKLYKNDELVSEFFPDRSKYPGLPHPPILIDDLIGGKLTDVEGFDSKKQQQARKAIGELCDEDAAETKKEGFMSFFFSKSRISLDEAAKLYEEYAVTRTEKTVFKFEGLVKGCPVITVIKEPVYKTRLKVNVSSRTLIHGEVYDTARVEIVAVDANDNRLTYFNDAITLSCEGALEIIGPSVISFLGGAAVFYVRTRGGRKSSQVKVTTQTMGDFNIDFSVIRKSSKEINISKIEEQKD